MRRRWKIFIVVTILGLLLAGWYAWTVYARIYQPNTRPTLQDVVLFIPTGATYQQVLDSISANDLLVNFKSFCWVARRMKYNEQSVKPGRYEIYSGMNNYTLIQKLRTGTQDPLNLVLHSARTIEEMAQKVAQQIEPDSAQLAEYILEHVMPRSTYNAYNILTLFIPNTYEVYWTMKPASFVERMQVEHERYWNDQRRNAAAEVGLSPDEAYTLASIVEKETQVPDERPVIAGVYLNRLDEGMPLQADPTIVFVLGDSVRRVLYHHLEIDSPYNTYRNPGLPPGPITMPSLASLEAVLHPARHDYLFFCAKPGAPGTHVFSETLSAHLRNARIYQRWLNAEGIR